MPEKHRFGIFVRTIGMKRAALKIGMVTLVYNVTRLVRLEGKTAPASAKISNRDTIAMSVIDDFLMCWYGTVSV